MTFTSDERLNERSDSSIKAVEVYDDGIDWSWGTTPADIYTHMYGRCPLSSSLGIALSSRRVAKNNIRFTFMEIARSRTKMRVINSPKPILKECPKPRDYLMEDIVIYE